MYKELGDDISGFRKPQHGSLVKWGQQGVLLRE
jgi:uracil DNA glycosylase